MTLAQGKEIPTKSMPDSLPAIDVIIPVWNRADEIVTCLSAIAAQTYPRELTKVYVVDNGSTDQTAGGVARLIG